MKSRHELDFSRMNRNVFDDEDWGYVKHLCSSQPTPWTVRQCRVDRRAQRAGPGMARADLQGFAAGHRDTECRV
jgi:hypothetical protein